MFTKYDIMLEFAEASRLGRMNHTEQYARWADRKWWNEIGFTTLRPKYDFKPEGAVQSVCDKCGGQLEHRPGNPRPFHLGGRCFSLASNRAP